MIRNCLPWLAGISILSVTIWGAAIPAAAQKASAGAVAPRPETEAARLLRSAESSARSGNWAAAIRQLERAATLAPNDPVPHRRLASVYRKARYPDREIVALEQALQRAPDDADSALRLGEIYISLVWFEKGREKVVQAERAGTTDPRLFVLLATQAYMRFQYPQMERAAVEGLRRFPGHVAIMTLLSEAYRLQGRLPEAETLLLRVRDTTADSQAKAACRTGLARLLLSEGWKPPRFADAEKEARAALRISPKETDAHYWLGRALQLQGKNDAAIEQYEIVYRRDPEFERTAYYLGGLYLRSRDKAKRALGERRMAAYRRLIARNERYRDARDAVWQHPERPEAHRRMGQEYLNVGQLPEAIVELREALRRRPEDSEARRLLVLALNKSGRKTEAMALDARPKARSQASASPMRKE
ncbi:MAG: tetratricopeptide repeat protein [Capsulimonadales bacterium]|nr:tetratricopeptide repeat protein [Capsulimonadales bacterium]